jgi:hypothetical protein
MTSTAEAYDRGFRDAVEASCSVDVRLLEQALKWERRARRLARRNFWLRLALGMASMVAAAASTVSLALWVNR